MFTEISWSSPRICRKITRIAAGCFHWMNAFLCEQSADSIKEENNYLFIYFASATIAVDSSHMTVPPPTPQSRPSPPSNSANGHASTMWPTAGHNHRKAIGRDPTRASHNNRIEAMKH